MLQEQNVSVEVVKMRLNTALTKAGIAIQELHKIESSMVYNADGLPGMQNFCQLIKKAKKAADEAHKIAKAPAKAECDACDEAKRVLYRELDELLAKVEPRMVEINAEEERKQRFTRELESKKRETKLFIANFLQEYSQKIAQCDTFDALRTVENRINLEKGNKSKYGDQYEEARSAFDILTGEITKQKEVIKQKVVLAKQLADAIEKQDDETALKIKDEQEVLDAQIEDNKIKVQEAAINIVVNQKPEEAEQVFTTLDAKRKYWKWEVVDIKETAKKMNAWTQVTPNEEKIDDFLKASKDVWNKEGKDEMVINGIKFYIDKKWS